MTQIQRAISLILMIKLLNLLLLFFIYFSLESNLKAKFFSHEKSFSQFKISPDILQFEETSEFLEKEDNKKENFLSFILFNHLVLNLDHRHFLVHYFLLNHLSQHDQLSKWRFSDLPPPGQFLI